VQPRRLPPLTGAWCTSLGCRVGVLAVVTAMNWWYASKLSAAMWGLAPFKAEMGGEAMRTAVAFAGACGHVRACLLPGRQATPPARRMLHTRGGMHAGASPLARVWALPLRDPPPRACLHTPAPCLTTGYLLVGLSNTAWMFAFALLKPEAGSKPNGAEQV
jgi:hypothetical protein